MKTKTKCVLQIEKDDPEIDIFKIKVEKDYFSSNNTKIISEFINFVINKITNKKCKVKMIEVDNNIMCEIRKPINREII